MEDTSGYLDYPFPTGSVIKLFSTLAYLYDGGEKNKILLCPKTESGSPIPPTCWYRPGHGYLDLKGAIANSCDTHFSKIFTIRRYDIFLKILFEYNLITENDLDKLRELSASEKRRVWIGIGKHLRIKPTKLLFTIYSFVGDGSLYRKSDSLIIFERKLNQKTMFTDVIREGMREGSLTGTTKIVQEILGLKKVFGKTGTATYFYNKEDYRKTHGFFIGFYPYPSPRWGILVFLLEGDGKTAAEIGANILKKYLEKKKDSY